jgi:hypothetical protein
MIALIILALLNMVDIGLTVWALRNGMREVNPFMRRAMTIIGVIPALALIKGVALVICYLALPVLGPIIWLCVALYAALIAWNVRAIMRWVRR